MKFLAAVLERQQAPLGLHVLEVPDTLYVGQVLVRVRYSGICGAQLGEIGGVKGPDKFLPHLLGHEGGVEVIAAGPGVRNVRPGDHAVLHWRKGTGIECTAPRYYCPELRAEVGGGWATSFNELAVVSENRLTKIPNDIPLDIAALLGCAVTTGLGVVVNDLQVKMGQSVIVLGCGGVGLNVLQGCMLASAYPIAGVDIDDSKLQQAVVFGATSTYNSKTGMFTNPGPVRATQDKNAFNMTFDYAIDTTGNPEVIEWAWRIARKVCLVAQVQHDKHVALQTLPMHQGKTILGSDGGGTNPTEDIPRYVKLLQAGRLNLAGLITHRVRLSQVNEILTDIRAGKVGRAIIEM